MVTKKQKPGTAVTVWEQEMAAAAHKQAAAEKPSGLFKSLSTRGGILAVDDEPVPGNELRVVVLSAVPENKYFENDYDPNTPQSPACYAFGDQEAEDPEEGMAPHEKASTPQCESCGECWANVMGSAERGRGKACKNIRKMAVVTEDALESADALAEAEARVLSLPVTSVNGWKKYVNKITEDMSRPSWGVVTLIKVVPDTKSQFKVLFSFEELINFDQGLYDTMKVRVAEVKRDLVAPYPDLSQAEPAPKQRGRQAPTKPIKGPVSKKPAPAAKGKPAPAPVAKGKPAPAPAAKGRSKY